MDAAKKLSWLVAILAALNLGLVLALVWPHLGGGRPPGPRDRNLSREADEFFERQLGASPEQVARLGELRRQFRQESDGLRERVRLARQSLALAVFADPADPASAALLLDELASCARRLDEMTFEHLQRVRAGCTPEQALRLKALLEEVLRRPEGGQPPRPEPPPR